MNRKTLQYNTNFLPKIKQKKEGKENGKIGWVGYSLV